MDLTAVPRILAKLEYSAFRLPIACLDEWVLAHYWDEDAPPRSDVRYFLGSLDEVAGWLLADDEIARRGETLLRRTRAPGPSGAPGAGTPPTGPPPAGPPPAGEPTTGEPPAGEPPRAAPPEAWSAGEATDATTAAAGPVAPDQARQDTADQARQDTAATAASTVDVAFTLPADVHADSVALCGDFNDWSAEATALERGDDGSWQISIPLEPGRSYRYRYLLDGERWANGQADRYEPNPYGGDDSVIVVE